MANLPGLPGNSSACAASVGPGVPRRSVVLGSPSLGAYTISTFNTAAGGLPPLPTVRVPAPSGGGAFGGSPNTPGGAGSSTKSSIVVPAPGRNKLMFTATTDVSDANIEREAGALCSRDNRGSGSVFRENRENAIGSLDPKFGVTRHFISSLAGEAEEGVATKDQQIQDSFAENLAKVGDLVEDMVKYDIKYIFDVSTLRSNYSNQKKLNKMWNDDAVDLWKNWDAITVKQVCYWQATLNKRCPIGSKDRITFE